MTETLNGLLTQKQGRDPQQGEIKLFTIEHRKGKSGKPYIKIKNATAEMGGQPYRILSAEKTDFVDQHGNISFSVEVEASSSAPTAFANARATMHRDLEDAYSVPQSPPHAQQGARRETGIPGFAKREYTNEHTQQGEDGVTEARKHLMRCCNLYNLCVAAAEKAIAPGLPNIAQTQEQFQSTLASLWIEASSRRCTNGVDWWSYIDKMPDTPIKNGKPIKANCTCENTDGDNPLCPIHST